MTPKILVAYATRAGSTAEVADAIGKKLAADGAMVDVKPRKKCSDFKRLSGRRSGKRHSPRRCFAGSDGFCQKP